MKRFLIRGGITAGLFAPLWFVTLVAVQSALNPDHNHVALPISTLGALDAGWIQNVNFYVFGALMAVLTIALHLVIKPAGAVGLVACSCY